MTTQYIDPQVIFASNAPEQDKPPAFNNYVKGMDETRSNDGRPTIKQLNFIQQQNDFKFLYIHERGSCLPFVEGFPYENNAVVFKDGFIQQKNGSSWVIPFMRGSQNLAELTDVAQARTKLDVYSKSEALSKASNLSELADKATARTNLGVYSKAETDAIAGTPNATEAVAGKAKIATTAIAQEGTNDTDFITPAKLKNVSFGMGQSWVDVTSSRLLNTVYKNTSNKTIFIAAQASQGTSHVRLMLLINGSLMPYVGGDWDSGGGNSGFFMPIPPNADYEIRNTGSSGAITIASCWEFK